MMRTAHARPDESLEAFDGHEYSRELGVKVLAGFKRLASLGFKTGGCPGFGLRRMLLSVDGRPKQLLAFGERKSITTDRVGHRSRARGGGGRCP